MSKILEGWSAPAAFGAGTPDGEGRQVARVNELLCKGCGSCAATCPAGAIRQLGFTAEQILAEISGALAGR